MASSSCPIREQILTSRHEQEAMGGLCSTTVCKLLSVVSMVAEELLSHRYGVMTLKIIWVGGARWKVSAPAQIPFSTSHFRLSSFISGHLFPILSINNNIHDKNWSQTSLPSRVFTIGMGWEVLMCV